MLKINNLQKKHLLIAGLSLACLGNFGAQTYAASTSQPLPMTDISMLPAPPNGQNPPGPPPDGKLGGMQHERSDASSLKASQIIEHTSHLTGQDLTNDKTDENVLLVRNGGSLTLTGSSLTKTGDSSSAKALLNDLLGYVFFAEGSNLEIVKTRAIEICSLLSRAAIEGGRDERQRS